MRLRPLVIALVVGTACLSVSSAAETSSGSPLSPASRAAPSSGRSARAVYFGVMGEVARPGAYAAPAGCSLTDAIKKAGGITLQADKSVRLFRGGLLTEQIFLGSGETPPLVPNDLIVVGGGGSAGPRLPSPAILDASGEPDEEVAVAAVQIAFVNLIEHPVIVKMPQDQATLARVVELLGQPADCAEKIRVFAPPGAGAGSTESNEQASRPLESGTVLVFPPGSVRRETLPALPEPIAEKVSTPSTPAAAHARADSKNADSRSSDRTPPDAARAGSNAALPSPALVVTAVRPVGSAAVVNPKANQSNHSCDIAPHVESDHPRTRLAQSIAAFQAARIRSLLAKSGEQPHAESHAGRIIAVMAAMSALAGLAMLLTFASIVQRWLASGKAPLGRLLATSSTGSAVPASSAGVPAPPIAVNLVGRPIRIDAGQPITRLSVDLAVQERAPQSTSAR